MLISCFHDFEDDLSTSEFGISIGVELIVNYTCTVSERLTISERMVLRFANSERKTVNVLTRWANGERMQSEAERTEKWERRFQGKDEKLWRRKCEDTKNWYYN